MDTQLERSPVYQQLNARLRAALAKDYRTGDRFLTEREISENFQVSRATANKALASLVSEGVLEFRRGVGTFVRRDVIDYDVRSLVSFTEKAVTAGKKPGTKVLAFGKLPAGEVPENVRTALQVAGDDLLWKMHRVRLADNIPVIFEHRFIVHRQCPKLTKSHAEGSLYRAWLDMRGPKIAGADAVIRAVLLTAEEAKHLQAATKSAALEVTSVGYLDDNSPLWWERTLYRSDQYEFHSRLGPIQSATPARGKLR